MPEMLTVAVPGAAKSSSVLTWSTDNVPVRLKPVMALAASDKEYVVSASSPLM